MAITYDLLAQFAKAATPKQESKKETTAYGTYVKYDGADYVQLDGSDLLTPVAKTANAKDGDRVTITIKNHSAILDGNLSSPSATSKEVSDVGNKITEFEIVVAGKVSTEELEVERGRIDELIAEDVLIKNNLSASEALIDELTAKDVEITGKLEAAEADIDHLTTNKLDASVADLTYATIEGLNATSADIYNLNATYGQFVDLTTGRLDAIDAEIKNLDVGSLTAEEAELLFANIEFTNIGDAAIENLFVKSGIIKDLIMSDGVVTGELTGVKINGDLITAGTLVADKLVIQGEDGLYYRLNTDGVSIEENQTEYNSLNGSVILADSIAANKIHVDDLYAFDATIGGFKITESSIYSGVKSSVDNTTRGSYLDDDGQFAIGDSSNYVKYYKDTDGKYKLAINANSLRFGAGNTSVEDYVSGQIDNLGDDYVKKPVVNGQNSQVVTVENALPDSIDGLRLYGKTIQSATASPDNPQELEHLGIDGEISTTTAGKNLIPFPYQFGNKLEVNGCTYTVTDDGGIVCSGTATDFSVAKLGYIPFVTDLTYRIYGDAANVRTEILLYDDSDSLDTLLTITDDTKTICRADYPSSVTKIFVRIRRSQNGSTLSGTAYPIVVAGTVAPDKYEPYKSTQTLISQTPNGLLGIPVTDASIATYTDKDGQMWICDEIDYGAGEYIQRIGEQIFDGSDDEEFSDRTSQYTGRKGNQCRFSANISDKKYGEYYAGLSNIGYTGYTAGVESYSDNGVSFFYKPSYDSSTTIYVTLENDEVTNLDAFKAFLSQNPICVQYVLAEPIRTPLFESKIEAFKALGNPSGNVTVYSEADISVELSDTSSTKGLEHQIDNVRDTIDQNSELVNKRFALTDELLAKLENCMSTLVRGDNGESLMVQTADGGWTFSMAQYNDLTSSLSESVSALQEFTGSTDASVKILQDAVASLQESAEYVRITVWDDEPCIELGEGDSDFKLMITNTRIMFLNGGMVPTYIDTTGLITQNITVNGEIRHGNFRWVQRSNGHYSLIR